MSEPFPVRLPAQERKGARGRALTARPSDAFVLNRDGSKIDDNTVRRWTASPLSQAACQAANAA